MNLFHIILVTANKRIVKLTILVLILLFINNVLFSQKYSIDNGRLKKSGKIGLSYKLNNLSELIKESKEFREINKQLRAEKKTTKKKAKRIQTTATLKRMKKLQKSSKRINQNKQDVYLNQRIYKYVSNKINSIVIQLKINVKIGLNKINGIFNNTNKINKRRKNYIIDINNN